MSEKDDILGLVNSMNNLPKSKDNFYGINIENTAKHSLDYEELVKWCEKNCKHPWKGIINDYSGHGWMRGIDGPDDFTFLFKHDDDAAYFKLLWKI